MKTAALIDQARSASGIASDYAIAKAVGTTRQSVSEWRAGVSYPGNLAAFKLAALAKRDPARVLAELEAERAERAGRTDQAASWRQLLDRLGSVVASILAAVILSAGLAPGNANARAGLPDGGADFTGHTSARKRRGRRAAAAQVFGRMADTLQAWPQTGREQRTC